MELPDEATQVLFSRFEHETPAGSPVYERELIQLATPQAWLTDQEVETLAKPKTDTNRNWLDRRTPHKSWWGLDHEATETISLGQLIDSPFVQGPNKLFRLRLLNHEYCWDHQSLPGFAHEIILEQIELMRAGFRELMALLIKRTGGPEGQIKEGQQLMMVDEHGYWCEPDIDMPDKRRNFYLQVLGELATRTDLSRDVIAL